MKYNSNQAKKDYAKHIQQRKSNLVRLREKIANMNQAAFAKDIDITTKDISTIESGDKNLSLFHIQAYRKYFKENYNLDVSVDYLLGYTDVIENRSMNIGKELGLSGSSIEMLKLMNDKKNNVYPENKKNLLMLNLILGSFYDDPLRPETHLYFTVLRKMWEYISLNPDNIGYYAPDKNGDCIIKDTVYTVRKERDEDEISHPIKIGEVYKYQLERELMDGIKKLEEVLKKKKSEK